MADATEPNATNAEHAILTRRELTGRALQFGAAAASVPAVAAAAGCGGDDDAASLLGDVIGKGGPTTTPRSGIPYPEGYVGPVVADKSPLVVGERPTLRIAVPQDVTVGDWNTNEFTKWYEERTNVHVEWQVLPGQDVQTKVNAMMAAGDIPDVFMNIAFTPAAQMLFGEQGVFRPLNGLIDDYGVEIKRVFHDYPDARDLVTATDGNIYALPDVNDCFHCQAGAGRTWVYKPWLDELGVGVPQTLEEFEEVLLAFKNDDPNANGENDEIPFTAEAESPFDPFVMGSFLYNPGEPWLLLDNGRVTSAVDRPQWREGIRYLRRLYRQGLVADESFTQTAEQLLRLGDTAGEPVLGAVRAFYWGTFLTIDEADPKARWKGYVTVPPLEGPDGTRVASWNYYSGIITGNFVVTSACKRPQLAVMWADGLYEGEAIVRSYAGVEGEDWRWAKPGEVGLDGRQGMYRILGTWGQSEGRTWAQRGVMYRSNDFRLSQVVDPEAPTFERDLHAHTERDYYEYRQPKEQQLPPLFMTAEQAAQAGELSTTLTNHVTQSFAEFVRGDLDIDDDRAWGAYVRTLREIGLPAYVALHQEAYEAKYST